MLTSRVTNLYLNGDFCCYNFTNASDWLWNFQQHADNKIYILYRVLRGHIIGSCPKNRLLGELRLLVFIVFERLGLLIPWSKSWLWLVMISLWVFQICAVQFWWIPWALCFTKKSFCGIPQKLSRPQFAAASVISNNNLFFFALVVLWEFVELNCEVDQKIFLLLPFQKITGVHEMRVCTKEHKFISNSHTE